MMAIICANFKLELVVVVSYCPLCQGLYVQGFMASMHKVLGFKLTFPLSSSLHQEHKEVKIGGKGVGKKKWALNLQEHLYHFLKLNPLAILSLPSRLAMSDMQLRPKHTDKTTFNEHASTLVIVRFSDQLSHDSLND